MSKVIVVTGGGSGIGRACALGLAQDGHLVYVTGRREAALQDTVSQAQGGNVRAIVGDVGVPDDVDRIFTSVQSEADRLDVLFNNAGSGTPPVPLEELSFAAWQRVVSANLTGTFLCTQWAFRLMKAQDPSGGRIINNGSISAHVPRPHSAPYTATKHGVTGLTRSAALDGRAHGITCGQIDIGNAYTERITTWSSSSDCKNSKSVKPTA
ncbi:MAG: SDR family oxidoreductase [Pseudomonadota bacterium]